MALHTCGINLVSQNLKKVNLILVVEDDIRATLERGKCCFIGKIMDEKRINHEAFKTTMLKVWKNEAAINIVEVGMNTF